MTWADPDDRQTGVLLVAKVDDVVSDWEAVVLSGLDASQDVLAEVGPGVIQGMDKYKKEQDAIEVADVGHKAWDKQEVGLLGQIVDPDRAGWHKRGKNGPGEFQVHIFQAVLLSRSV